jgi:importin subunit alpha-1
LLIFDDSEIKKEAVWAVSNCTAGASAEQFGILVEKNIIKALLSVLSMKDARILAVALEGLENILKIGQEHYMIGGENKFALKLEAEGGLDQLEPL